MQKVPWGQSKSDETQPHELMEACLDEPLEHLRSARAASHRAAGAPLTCMLLAV